MVEREVRLWVPPLPLKRIVQFSEPIATSPAVTIVRCSKLRSPAIWTN
jgi:hypothetical protein